MLTDQIFSKPIEVVIGPEVFHADNALGLDMGRIRLFQSKIIPSGMYRLFYLHFSDDPEAVAIDNSLAELGIGRVSIGLMGRSAIKIKPANLKLLRDLSGSDITFPNELLRAMGVRPVHEYPYNDPDRFVEALALQTELKSAFSWERFVSL